MPLGSSTRIHGVRTALHLPFEVAGQVGAQVRALRDQGLVTSGLFPGHVFGYTNEPDYSYPANRRFVSGATRLLRAFQVAGRFDVYHYHGGGSLLPLRAGFLDARINRLLGNRVIVEFWGSEVRKPGIEALRNPWYVNAYEENDQRADFIMSRWANITGGHAIVADHSFLASVNPWFDNIHIVRQIIDCDRFTPSYPSSFVTRPRVIHIPSNLACKGTDFVRAAVEQLRTEGQPFEYEELHGVAHREAMRRCASADIVIDQLRIGSHGVFALEAMALGKPVICYLLPEIVPTYPENIPLINANPGNLSSVLREWINAPGSLRHDRGQESRLYVERVHSAPIIAAQLIELYAGLPARS